MSDTYLETQFSLKGKTAVVIGGTGELCGAMATGLAGAGAHVVLVGRSAGKAEQRLATIRKLGAAAPHFVQCDVSSKPNFETLLANVLQISDRIDIVINGAGANSPTPFFEISDDELQNLFQVNFNSIFWSCQVFGQNWITKRQSASVINIGSLSGLIPLSKVFTYSASKAAVHNLSRNLAREWAPHKIRVNTLVPGFFPAEQNKKVLSPDRIERILAHTPLNRFGEPSELIGATLLLASDAGRFITGAELVVDGGFSATTI
jgi:NAD(P)-dependent dehydrogenase (short-subunit alcohol dehydrogenase family)